MTNIQIFQLLKKRKRAGYEYNSELTRGKIDATIKKSNPIFAVDLAGNIKKVNEKESKKLTKKKFDVTYLNVGYYIITPIIIGVFLGLGVDYWAGTKPFFTSIFLFLGTVASFYNLFKLLKNGE
ncbi:AtpZ/AtpI family protein [Candidatus Roizmanbacteria bacterium]|nr:AtpZ/AtpI family protein [Candidatus Roizmanbacteria bacterium]